MDDVPRSLDDLLKQQTVALANSDTVQALELLDAIEEEIDRANAWVWLQQNTPESYDQLIRKVEHAATTLAQGGRSELGHLARVFRRLWVLLDWPTV